MNQLNIDELRAAVLNLPRAERAALARELDASLEISPAKASLKKRGYQRRMQNYVDNAWRLASRTLMT